MAEIRGASHLSEARTTQLRGDLDPPIWNRPVVFEQYDLALGQGQLKIAVPTELDCPIGSCPCAAQQRGRPTARRSAEQKRFQTGSGR